jgi:AraC-like DNA-binding protein
MWRGMLTSYLELFLIGFYRRHREAFPAESGRTAKLACEIQNYISENCRAQMTVDDIAARFFISKYYLCHVFKRQTGYPVRRFMLLQRLAAAEEMLVYSDMPVSDICTSCGFGNESNFTRSFGAVYGMSPLKYRKFANEKFIPAKGAE